MSNWFYLNELIYFNNCSNNVQRHRALVNMALYKCCILLLLLLLFGVCSVVPASPSLVSSFTVRRT